MELLKLVIWSASENKPPRGQEAPRGVGASWAESDIVYLFTLLSRVGWKSGTVTPSMAEPWFLRNYTKTNAKLVQETFGWTGCHGREPVTQLCFC